MIKRALFSVPVVVLLYVLTGCENSLIDRSLIFSTHTTLGVELSVTPSETSGPVNIIMGYKRTEGVLNPVYYSQGIETPDKEITTNSENGTKTVETTGRRPRYRDEAYSVIAKFTGETTGTANKIASAGMSVAQWFATGEAAKTLANQPGIAGAVTGSSEIANAAANEALGAAHDTRSKLIAFTLLNPIYKELRRLAEEGDLQAKALADKMDTIKPDQLQYDFQRYLYREGNLTDTVQYTPMSGDAFLLFHGYCTKLEETMEQLTNAVMDQGLSKYNDMPITDITKKRKELYSKLEKLKDKQTACKQLVQQNQDTIRAAVDYFYH